MKWFRSEEYYSRPIKGPVGTPKAEARSLTRPFTQSTLLYLMGAVKSVQGIWQLGARHKIESEDAVNGLLEYESGATGVIQASTAFSARLTERIEIDGTKGTAIISGDQLTSWDVLDDDVANAGRPRTPGEKCSFRICRPHGYQRSHVRAPVPGFRRRDTYSTPACSSPARRVIAHWKSCWASIRLVKRGGRR